MPALLEATEIRWTPELRRVNSQYPTAVRSKNWPEIARLANSGQIDSAMSLASRGLINPNIRRRTAIARRMRIERMSFFNRINSAKKDLQTIFGNIYNSLEPSITKKSSEKKNLNLLMDRVDDAIIILRRELNKWMRAFVKDSARLGLKNSGEALLPFFKANRESITEELSFLNSIELVEARLSLGLVTSFAKRANPVVKTSHDKWSNVLQKVVNIITKRTASGIKPSQRIWDLTQRTRLEMQRLIVSNVTQGKNPTVIARELKKFLSPGALDNTQMGPGLYKSPFKNAFRLAQTEANRAYTHASAEFAEDKPWIEGIQITLSPVHSHSDICDQWAGKIVTPEEFRDMVPFHPHCRCYATYVLKDDIFDKAA